jgi:hypothetical protein
MIRILALPVLRCDGCGDELVAPAGVAMCGRCRRRAELRRRLARQAGVRAIVERLAEGRAA